MNTYSKHLKENYTTLFVRRDLKKRLADCSTSTGIKMSYPETIDYLIQFYNENRKTT